MDIRPTRYEALLACRDAAGSISQLGRDLGIPQSTMSRIVHQSKQLPAEHVIRAESLYGVSRHHLRPDIYPVELPGHPRFVGVDHCAALRFQGVDTAARRVPFKHLTETKGAAA
ncbi:transcriptional regulator [Novosphingobium colocasiae]|uniref:transcriptional regulator n=1 Tax=Novosphingobium colocasiae TaxID=1256513 RepID=UPI001674ECFC|nr:YdaS family helix-turn-helix protein [Novosphingobium colocasiae]